MNLKKQLAAGGALLAVTAAACLKLAQWAGRQIEKRQRKKVICRSLRPAEKNKNVYPAVLIFHFPGAKNFPRGQQGN